MLKRKFWRRQDSNLCPPDPGYRALDRSATLDPLIFLNLTNIQPSTFVYSTTSYFNFNYIVLQSMQIGLDLVSSLLYMSNTLTYNVSDPALYSICVYIES